jgi:hypothetical protein
MSLEEAKAQFEAKRKAAADRRTAARDALLRFAAGQHVDVLNAAERAYEANPLDHDAIANLAIADDLAAEIEKAVTVACGRYHVRAHVGAQRAAASDRAEERREANHAALRKGGQIQAGPVPMVTGAASHM